MTKKNTFLSRGILCLLLLLCILSHIYNFVTGTTQKANETKTSAANIQSYSKSSWRNIPMNMNTTTLTISSTGAVPAAVSSISNDEVRRKRTPRTAKWWTQEPRETKGEHTQGRLGLSRERRGQKRLRTGVRRRGFTEPVSRRASLQRGSTEPLVAAQLFPTWLWTKKQNLYQAHQ